MRTRRPLWLGITVAAIILSALAAATLRAPRSASGGRWFKANLHAHSNKSDGDSPPERVVQYYKEHGYDVLAISDHDVFTDPAPLQPAAGTLLIIGAEELSASDQLHVNAIGIHKLVKPRSGPSRTLMVLDNVTAVREAGGIPVLNHPHLSRLTVEELKGIDETFMLEISEGGVMSDQRGVSSAGEKLWDQLLALERPVLGVVTDDAHYFNKATNEPLAPGKAWVMVRAGQLTRDAILDALRRGDFFASSGIMLERIDTDGANLRVQIAAAPGRKYVTSFIGRGGQLLSSSTENPASYAAVPDDHYVRARVEADDGTKAWTQPLWSSRGGSRWPN